MEKWKSSQLHHIYSIGRGMNVLQVVPENPVTFNIWHNIGIPNPIRKHPDTVLLKFKKHSFTFLNLCICFNNNKNKFDNSIKLYYIQTIKQFSFIYLR